MADIYRQLVAILRANGCPHREGQSRNLVLARQQTARHRTAFDQIAAYSQRRAQAGWPSQGILMGPFVRLRSNKTSINELLRD